MTTVAFVFGLCIAAIGAIGLVTPAALVWFADQFVTPFAFYVLAVVRIGFGLVFVMASSESRLPTTLRVLGGLAIVSGIAAAAMAFVAVDEARAMIAWWEGLGPVLVRATTVVVLMFGGVVAYACAPTSSGASHPTARRNSPHPQNDASPSC